MATDKAQSSSSHVTFQKVSSLSVFKTVSTGVRADTRDALVASVTPQEPRLMRVANGMKVVGSLDAGRATVRVELVKRGDCQSEFTCHVRGLDSQGREAVSTASLVQQPRHRENQVDDGKMMSSLSLQLLASIQQLVTQSVAGLEDKLDSLEHRLDDKLEAMEHRLMKELEQGEERIDDKLRRFQRASEDQSGTFERVVLNRVLLLENRLENKIDRNSNRKNFIRRDSNCSIELAQFRSDLKTMIFDTLVQRRSTGNIDFNRLWDDYKTGFGSFYDDFWLGNDKLHAITSNGSYELEVTMKFKGKKAYARYADFAVGNETENYKLSIGRYFGTAGESFSYHNGAPFSTIDRDNDETPGNCVEKHGGGWWFRSCDNCNLNGNWRAGSDFGLEWTKFAGADSVSYSEMKIRKV
ncbi:fibrinogen-related protein 3-2 [Elysia marginata]|uniref:Fibrinogen-related protein 3-2 n=1 Tax=Elysia marginata TaxID=1093978 RepID=A0AAV4HZD3_9GAST|nr:fibrinogen-related protein 3-2 [Elysia marginata]